MNKNNNVRKGKSRIKVTSESPSGRNQNFKDTIVGEDMTRSEFISKIKAGIYPDFYVRRQNGVMTPVSKPDGDTSNNLD